MYVFTKQGCPKRYELQDDYVEVVDSDIELVLDVIDLTPVERDSLIVGLVLKGFSLVPIDDGHVPYK